MTTPTPPPVVGPGRSSVDRQSLDTALANVSDGLGEALNETNAASRLAGKLAGITQATLEAAPPDGFGYTTDQAYAIKLYGDSLTAFIAAWKDGAALPTQPLPLAGQALTSGGL